MKIAITSQNLDPKIVVSGISTVVSTIVNLSDNQYHVYEVGYRDGNKRKNLKWLLRQLKLLIKFPLFIKRNDIEIVHINIPFDTLGIIRDSLLVVISKLCRRKVLLHIHGGKSLMIPAKNPLILFLVKIILSKSDKILVLSEIEKEVLKTNYFFDKAEVLLNAVDTSQIEFKGFVNNRENGYNEKYVILYLARITESKGIDDVLDAFRELYLKKKFKFILCGSGDKAQELVSEFEKIMGSDFEFKGVVSGEEKLNIIAGADIFLLPSRHSEGLPMSLLETMAAGLVPVVTNEASMIKVVKDGVNGIVTRKYDGKYLSEKLFDIMNAPELLQSLSIEARKTIEMEYDTRDFVGNLDKIYQSI